MYNKSGMCRKKHECEKRNRSMTEQKRPEISIIVPVYKVEQ